MSAYIKTSSGITLVIDNVPYTVSCDHVNYNLVVDAIKHNKFDLIPDMINMSNAIKSYIDQQQMLSIVGSTLVFNGKELHSKLAQTIINMKEDGFDISPVVKFLTNLLNNPSNKSVDELYGWIERNHLTITEDGHFIAYKRINADMTSMYDNTTSHQIGQTVEMTRNQVDDRSDVTCSHGLHFCSQQYLQYYNSGQGVVVLLKINPADVVSIPTDYGHAKGRACKYVVLAKLDQFTQATAETTNVVNQTVVTDDTNYNASLEFKTGYALGYKHGRGKQKKDQSPVTATTAHGYIVGYKDGRKKLPKLY